MAEASGSRRVVIVGGGFAGLFAARALSSAPVQVTLLDRAEHHLFQPMLYQCATGIMSEGKIAYPLRELLRKHGNVEFVIAEVNGIDAAERRVQARRPLRQQIEFGYDYLILASATASERYSAAPRSTSTASSTTVRERSSRQHNLPARTKS
jgi:NADH:ubiquinone reductase (H+-translocating)